MELLAFNHYTNYCSIAYTDTANLNTQGHSKSLLWELLFPSKKQKYVWINHPTLAKAFKTLLMCIRVLMTPDWRCWLFYVYGTEPCVGRSPMHGILAEMRLLALLFCWISDRTFLIQYTLFIKVASGKHIHCRTLLSPTNKTLAADHEHHTYLRSANICMYRDTTNESFAFILTINLSDLLPL